MSSEKYGITGYGAYGPRLRIKAEEIAKVWGGSAEQIKEGLLVDEKSVPEIDEDTITISTEAGRNALARAQIDKKKIGALFVGSESHPAAAIESMFSFTSDTPDFWRREGEDFPRHGSRFTGEPAYFKHIVSASKGLME